MPERYARCTSPSVRAKAIQMKRLAQIFGYLCGLAFVVVLVVMIVNMVNNNPFVNYGVIGVVLALLAVGAERFGNS
jgi:steroid 5-alpha reductase family enzyme